MKNIIQYKHRKVLVLGLARSGVSAASLLHKLGAFVTVNDQKPFSENPEAQGLLEQGIKVICGSHPVELLDEGFELVVKNPGIPYDNPMIKKAQDLMIPIITEVELAYQISDAPIIGITGTNGKTTTTTIVHHMLNEMTPNKSLLAGNIGFPGSEVAEKATAEQYIAMELSSFQLMGIRTFCPKIAVITNIYEAHIDYHKTREEYVKAKWRIQENQTKNEFLVINWDQDELRNMTKRTKAKVIPFSPTQKLGEGAYVKDGNIMFYDEIIGKRDDILLPGEHNLENILASIAVAKICDVSNEQIMHVLETFKGVEHRTQFVKELNGRKFYNDSKATNILATQSALSGFNKPVVLLAGGLDRGTEFDELKPFFKNVKTLITFGETAEKVGRVGKEAGVDVHQVHDVTAAVPLAYELSNPGDIILLSPACASWDQYRTFEVRGRAFMDAIEELPDEVEK
ncbi:UDP-N-acetylmuramoyl-L-alanine--D-glutamate ligase [Listeria newyorkensis]|uniref:UDP-N-acetylmuramoylalanine--D-glutamate ligase n=1 Tax=Listeria newyorkensis TaxID=1497681 RepID=A0ABX4XL47_9LIST|nr:MULTISPECIES: UDP-N-acetylmuramoyl-L-alanine--D-glutamate ligase [Listeria]KGL44754.1 UDP-N-acetylmuramoyl-L-alanyl-D-glutamate synthetase [Listeriaceae bacterium FSL A5-0209]KGL41121.1 UDP-N-acetylmuramoyl-L-alanyl-D-glutamate synthetase [Listeria newyorkensis]KMT59589.1 UDP-N-acetylmuramoyl-L-alanyl-D-glutamate synthetase [Listeria newyorkensis]PNP91116.1 UDP-N-acetylmuramoyl-L-alanine--D-glutamate ligase [Listeria newyorkensis]RQW68526.1 UDP-N-acetylmuramoyl-L-alanine--D-glutamate ligase